MSKTSRSIPSTQFSIGSYSAQMSIESSDSHLEEAADQALALLNATTSLELVRLSADKSRQWKKGNQQSVIETSFTVGNRKYAVTHTFELELKVDEAALEYVVATRIQPVLQRALGSYIGGGQYGIMPIPSIDVLTSEFVSSVESFVHGQSMATASPSSRR